MTPTFNVDPNLVGFWNSRGNNILVSAWSGVIAPNYQLQLGFGLNHVHLQMNAQNQLTTAGWVQMDNLLPNYSDYYAPLTFGWAISPDNGLTWITPAVAQTSSNQTYITLANPVAAGVIPAGMGFVGGIAQVQKPAIEQTVFYAGVWGTISPSNFFAGSPQYLFATDQTGLVADVFAGFQYRDMTRADGTGMTYYGNWNTQNYTTEALIQNHDGQCNAWARFFIDVLRAEGGDFSYSGAQSNLIGIFRVNPLPTDFFLVKNWSFGAANIPAPLQLLSGYTNSNQYGNQAFQQVNGVWQYTWTLGANANVQDQQGLPGQNNPNPKSTFANHEVVLIGNTLFDPSYGVTCTLGPANNPLANFEADAIAGYGTTWNDNTGNFLIFRTPGAGPTSQRLVMRTLS